MGESKTKWPPRWEIIRNNLITGIPSLAGIFYVANDRLDLGVAFAFVAMGAGWCISKLPTAAYAPLEKHCDHDA